MFVFEYTCVQVFVSVSTHVEVRVIFQVFSSITLSFFIFLRQRLSLNLEMTVSSTLAS